MKKSSNIFGGIIGGILFFFIGIIMLWTNEGNNVKNIKTIKEASNAVINVSSDKVLYENEGKLVATNGKMVIMDSSLTDSLFGVQVKNTAKLKRVVKMFQWQEEKETKNDETTYSYKKVWSSSLINSSDFNNSGYTNPSYMPYTEDVFLARNVKLGAYELTVNQLDKLETKTSLTLNGDYNLPIGYKVSGNYITNSDNLSSPKIGDIMISYEYNNDSEVSVLAKQSGNTFVDYTSKSGKILHEVSSGIKSGEDMIAEIEKTNNMLKWILRAVGTVMIMCAFALILSPITKLTSFIPLLGNAINGVIGFVSSLLGLALSLLIIAIAWIRFRPVLGIVLLAAVVILVIIVVTLIKKNKVKRVNNVQTNINTLG